MVTAAALLCLIRKGQLLAMLSAGVGRKAATVYRTLTVCSRCPRPLATVHSGRLVSFV